MKILTSQDSFTKDDTFTLQQLVSKHPKPLRYLQYPQPTDNNYVTLMVNEKVQNAIMSFFNGSAARIDSLRPQHLRDLIGKSVKQGNNYCPILQALNLSS